MSDHFSLAFFIASCNKHWSNSKDPKICQLAGYTWANFSSRPLAICPGQQIVVVCCSQNVRNRLCVICRCLITLLLDLWD
ncbi:hypothetical protein GDO86_012698 [Hymenochirus boettgeri]|uniref:Uncharacterized protein n=1 Tax=Hymenochirus boettgeri TaxID=247094 RepID=A0A8T2IRN0_9PIPI|nr:hypothetical protein GDO86_012698 [Hymenochirus boettgeri]